MGFRSEAALRDWLERTGHELGFVTTAQTMFDLSKDWYAGRMDEGWDPPGPERAESVFAAHGLIGEFWRLSG
jgi:hypothetical protein